jgi:hypothetical protein
MGAHLPTPVTSHQSPVTSHQPPATSQAYTRGATSEPTHPTHTGPSSDTSQEDQGPSARAWLHSAHAHRLAPCPCTHLDWCKPLGCKEVRDAVRADFRVHDYVQRAPAPGQPVHHQSNFKMQMRGACKQATPRQTLGGRRAHTPLVGQCRIVCSTSPCDPKPPHPPPPNTHTCTHLSPTHLAIVSALFRMAAMRVSELKSTKSSASSLGSPPCGQGQQRSRNCVSTSTHPADTQMHSTLARPQRMRR